MQSTFIEKNSKLERSMGILTNFLSSISISFDRFLMFLIVQLIHNANNVFNAPCYGWMVINKLD